MPFVGLKWSNKVRDVTDSILSCKAPGLQKKRKEH